MYKIMLLGKNGQVGWELYRTLAPLGEVVALGREELDLENSRDIREMVISLKPNIIVNTAAYTGVDQAEMEPDRAKTINAIAPGVLAEEAERIKALLIHYSTDFVFDGRKKTPYTEVDRTNPLNTYGMTKLLGENNIKSTRVKYLILRTCWVYGNRRNNFFLTIKRLARERARLQVVYDQRGSPTWCRMVAEATAIMIHNLVRKENELYGTYNLCASGQCSRFEFAREILNREKNYNKLAELMPVTSSEYQTKAVRPANSVLSCEKLKNDFGLVLPLWEQNLEFVFENDETMGLYNE